jgi:DNA modification methylase
MTQPYYQDDHVTLYHGDSLEILPALTFDIMVTDPPYGIGYEIGGFPGSQVFAAIKGDDSIDLMAWALTQPFRSVIFGAEHAAPYVDINSTWHVWDKRETIEADNILGTPFELCVTSWKCERQIFRCLHAGSVNADRKIARQGRRVHPTQKPVVLMRKIIELWTDPDDVILDPFAGSGSTLRAAKDLGRHAIGIEIEEQYCEAIVSRLAQEVLSL